MQAYLITEAGYEYNDNWYELNNEFVVHEDVFLNEADAIVAKYRLDQADKQVGLPIRDQYDDDVFDRFKIVKIQIPEGAMGNEGLRNC